MDDGNIRTNEGAEMIMLGKSIKAQSTVEFTFAVVVIMFLIYGMVQVFRWAGIDLAQRQYQMENGALTYSATGDPAYQLTDDIQGVQPIAGVYHGKITYGNSMRR